MKNVISNLTKKFPNYCINPISDYLCLKQVKNLERIQWREKIILHKGETIHVVGVNNDALFDTEVINYFLENKINALSRYLYSKTTESYKIAVDRGHLARNVTEEEFYGNNLDDFVCIPEFNGNDKNNLMILVLDKTDKSQLEQIAIGFLDKNDISYEKVCVCTPKPQQHN